MIMYSPADRALPASFYLYNSQFSFFSYFSFLQLQLEIVLPLSPFFATGYWNLWFMTASKGQFLTIEKHL